MSGRAVVMLVAGVFLALVLFTAVVRPAVERGGVGEIGLVIGAVVAILLVERWLRTR